MEQIIITHKKAAYISVAAFLLVLAAVFGWLYIDKLTDGDRSVDVVQSLFCGAAVGAMVGVITCLAKVFTKKPVMVMDNEGIHNISDLNGISLKWNDVVGAQVETDKRNNRTLVISVKHIDQVLAGMKRSKKRVANINIKKYGSPLVIAKLFAEFDPEQTMEFINDRAGVTVNAN